MNKSELAAEVAKRTGTSKEAAALAVNTTLDVIQDTVASGEEVALVGFGAFKRGTRKATDARNPRTGEAVHVPPALVPRFKAGATFKTRVKTPDQSAA